MQSFYRFSIGSAYTVLTMLFFACSSDRSLAFGDFPLSSCKGWNATITRKSGIGTRTATLMGRVTRAGVREFCERDPGGETVENGGKLTLDECTNRYFAREKRKQVVSRADCETGRFEFQSSGQSIKRIQFPIEADIDKSCASGLPPLQAQYEILCPNKATLSPTHGQSVELTLRRIRVLQSAFNGRVKKVSADFIGRARKTHSALLLVDCNPDFRTVKKGEVLWMIDAMADRSNSGMPLVEVWKKTCL